MTLPPDFARLEGRMSAAVREHWKAFLIEGILLVILGIWAAGLADLQPIGRLVELIAVIVLISVLWPRVKIFGV